MKEHLLKRYCETERYTCYIDEETHAATFFLFNLTGQLVGYQKYDPLANKDGRNDQYGKYYTWCLDEGEGGKSKKALAFFGWESYYYRSDILCVTEGLFNAARLHTREIPCLALLGNDLKKSMSLLRTIGIRRKILAICDGDEAGRKLAKFGDVSFECGTNDVNDMTTFEFENLLKWIESV